MWKLRLLARVASLLFDPLLAASRKGCDSRRDGVGECFELLHIDGFDCGAVLWEGWDEMRRALFGLS